MGQFLEYFRIALFNIKANKVRSFLTMLGIIIGISSVIMIISAGNGIKNGIYDELNGLVGNLIEVYTNEQDENGNYVNFYESDLEAINEKIEHLKGATMLLQLGNCYTESSKGMFSTQVKMGNEYLEFFGNEKVGKGRYFTKEEYEAGDSVCVITAKDALRMFGTEDVLGMMLSVEIAGITHDYKIVGVREQSDSALAGMMFGSSNVVIEVPFTILYNVLGIDFGDFPYLIAFAESPEYTDQIAEDIVPLLEARHNVRGQKAIGIYQYSSELDQFNVIINVITIFIGLVATISLIVGGIGVMNIMLVSVTERTREIGIRKSLGARTSSILFQFLIEASVISLLGGIIGIILGLTGAWGLCAIAGNLANMSLHADFNVIVIALATLFSIGIGICFGIFPAKKAAKLNPIEALRHE